MMEHQSEKESQYLTSELRCKLHNWTYTLEYSLTSKAAEQFWKWYWQLSGELPP